VDVDRQLIHDVAEAMLTHRLTLGGPLDDAFIGRLVDDVLLVLIRPGAR
ncbi:TetR family transcriptional regulator, partial [Mycobacteroides abscessus subsp. abscessus]|nr:TetR family transcriptional regulator [Mycobacteroides abscessus subsp. abscessus]